MGYTNAGKSTLFNSLTSAKVYAADQLFATLDPTLRRLEIGDAGSLLLVDTVGFIRHLPHKLVEAFRATLEESREADLLLHVVDACSEHREETIYQVESVLKEIQADQVPVLMVYNKIDLMGDFKPRVDRDERGLPQRVWLSAKTGEGLDLLLDALTEILAPAMVQMTVRLAPAQGQFRAYLYQLNGVRREWHDDTGHSVIEVRMPKKDFEHAIKKFGLTAAGLRHDAQE